MKIIIAFVGRFNSNTVVIPIKSFINLLNHYKNIFKNYDAEFRLYSWEGEKKEIIETLKQNIAVKFYPPEDDMKLQNTITQFKKINKKAEYFKNYIKKYGVAPGASSVNIYKMYSLRKLAIRDIYHNNPDSYTFMIRPDLFIDFKNIEQFINKDIYNVQDTLPLRKCEKFKPELLGAFHGPISDHCSIGSTQILYNFYNMNETEISSLFSRTTNAETSILQRLKDINLQYKIHHVDKYDIYRISLFTHK